MKQKLMLVVFGAALAAAIFVMVPAAQAAGKERHPKIKAAIAALDAAKKEMQTAAHDFGGHRVAALAACDESLKQLQLCLDYDKK